MVKGREDLQRKKGEELFSLCPLEWFLKAIVTCEQSLSAISSLDLGSWGELLGDSVPPPPPPKGTTAEEKSRESACLVDLIT